MRDTYDLLRKQIQALAREEVHDVVRPLKEKVAELSKIGTAHNLAVSELGKILSRLDAGPQTRGAQPRREKADGAGGAGMRPKSIRTLRDRLGLGRREFGRLAGVSRNTIFLWESGQVSPKEESEKAIVGLQGLDGEAARRRLAAMPLDVKAAKSRGKRGKAVRSRQRARRKP